MACLATELQTELGCIPTDPLGFVARFYSIGLGLIGGLAVLFIIYGGYLLMTSQGDLRRVESGKSYIIYSIMGLLLAIFGYVFMQIIVVDVLKLPGFS